jgi:hypothetical protein
MSPFPCGGEEAARDLTLGLVEGDALAAIAPLVAGGVGAGAVFFGLGGDTFHKIPRLIDNATFER